MHWNIINSLARCFEHKIPVEFKSVIKLKNQKIMDVPVTSEFICFIVQSLVQITVNFIILQSIQTKIHFYCDDNVDLTIRLIVLFPDQAEINVDTFLCGNNSRVTILGMYALAGQQNLIIKTRQVHCGKNCSSQLVMQGLISGHAKSFYEGTIRIQESACGTYALQNNKNILLSDMSSAISIPNIEVLNHDVQCYHGAAVGKFDTQQMQYMQSRGLNDATIQQLLIQTLFEEVLQRYENKELILQNVYEKI